MKWDMKDELKNFAEKHRSEFDTREPRPSVWNSIENQLPRLSRAWWNSVWMWQAAAVLLAVLSVYLWVSSPKSAPTFAKRNLQVEFTDLESFYTSQINEKVELISDLSGAWDAESHTQDMQKLEAMYQVLREQMKTRPSQEVKDALVLNLLIRIDLLNQQIQRLETKKEDPAKQAS